MAIYTFKVTKEGYVTVEADNEAAAEDIARGIEAEGAVDMDLVVECVAAGDTQG